MQAWYNYIGLFGAFDVKFVGFGNDFVLYGRITLLKRPKSEGAFLTLPDSDHRMVKFPGIQNPAARVVANWAIHRSIL